MSTFIGVDVSRWQGDINFDQLKTAVSFVLYKGTGADDGLYADSEFLRNHAEARRTGMHRGIYHFGGGFDPIIEANYFFEQCLTNLEPGEVVILDAEYGQATDPGWCLTFLNHLESLIGFKPMIYMNQNLMLTKDWSQVAAGNFGLWIADWNGDPNLIIQMKYWSFCAMQQFTDNGHVAGIAGTVDEDGFFAPDISFFDKYGKPAASPTPPTAPAPPAPAPADPSAPATPTAPEDPGEQTPVTVNPPSTPSGSDNKPLPGLTNNIPPAKPQPKTVVSESFEDSVFVAIGKFFEAVWKALFG